VIRLEENKARAQELEEEKQMYNEQASELQATIHDLTLQKEMTEAELKVTSEIADPWEISMSWTANPWNLNVWD